MLEEDQAPKPEENEQEPKQAIEEQPEQVQPAQEQENTQAQEQVQGQEQVQDQVQDQVQVQEPTYRYHWDYGAQSAFDRSVRKKNPVKGVLVYALILCTVVLLCMGALIGTLIWYQTDGFGKPSPILTTTEVSELVKPSTVLIMAYHGSAYSYGTGFFIREDGYIATNYHVLSEHNTYRVQLLSGETLTAKLVGFREEEDLAVLKIDGNGYPTVKIGNVDELLVGETAIAIGNPAGVSGSWSTTQGIISALERVIMVEGSDHFAELKMIQTDAPVNHGNSGGPLCNNRGEVVGIITRKLTDYENIGFALPINGAMELLNAIIQSGNADDVVTDFSRVRPKIGVTGREIEKGAHYQAGGKRYTATNGGILVESIDRKSGAYGFLYVNDLIIEADGKTVSDLDDFSEALYGHKKGDVIQVKVIRPGVEKTIQIILGLQ